MRAAAITLGLIFAAAVSAASAVSAGADEMPDGDAEYGAYLSGECVTCHKADGADEGIPSITGWEPEAFFHALLAFRSGEREHEAMQLVASRLSDEEIAGLAVYFGGLE